MLAALAAAATVAVLLAVTWPRGQAGPPPLCGAPGPAPAAVKHVIIVMLENRTYRQATSRGAAPFEAGLARHCGNATEAFATTHGSAANYLAVAGGRVPPGSLHGCDYAACASDGDSLFQQLDAAGLSWKAYQEAMPRPCDKVSAWPYKIGHDPAIFYTGISAAQCRARVVPVASLTARSGPFYRDLRRSALPSLAWVTPSRIHDGEDDCSRACALRSADTWLRRFLALVAAAPSYRNGSVLVLVTYDEGTGPDNAFGEDCTDRAADLAGRQPSCHVPLFVVKQYARARSSPAFYTGYSLTRTVEDIFGLPCLAHACQAVSLTGAAFGLPRR